MVTLEQWRRRMFLLDKTVILISQREKKNGKCGCGDMYFMKMQIGTLDGWTDTPPSQ